MDEMFNFVCEEWLSEIYFQYWNIQYIGVYFVND